MSTAAVASEAVIVDGPVGMLEGALDSVTSVPPRFACVVCHPHPLQAGTMNNKVVTTIARSIARFGGVCLRFNYRGVGHSEGAYDGERGELDDALAAIQWLQTNHGAELPLVVAGFSFGGAIAWRAASAVESSALITVAPAHERIPAATSRSVLPPWLLVQGDADDVIPAAGVFEWAATHEPEPQIVSFPETGHFFHGRLPQLADTVTGFLQKAGV